MRFAPLPLALIALVGLARAECERTPPEDFGSRSRPAPPPPAQTTAAAAPPLDPPPPASGATLTAPAPAIPPGRCVLPTPAQAPPPVAPGPARGCPPDPESNQQVPVARVEFPEATDKPGVDAEIVRTEHDTQRGLMYRTSMAEDRGMLFDLRVRDDHQFWMHNTCIPLDLLYIDEDGLLVGIVENAPTLDDTSRGVGCPSRFVLETNAGWSRRHGVRAGQHVRLPR